MCDGDVSKDEQVHPVDANLPMADVIRVFGPFVKLVVSGRPDAIPGSSVHAAQGCSRNSPPRPAFLSAAIDSPTKEGPGAKS